MPDDHRNRPVSRLILPSVGPIEQFAVTPKLTLLALANWGPVSVWDVKSYGFAYRALVDQVAYELAWSNAGSTLAMLTPGAVAVAKAGKAGEPVWPARVVTRLEASGRALTFSPGDDALLVATDRGLAAVTVADGTITWVTDEPTRALRYTPGGELLAGGEDGTLSLWHTDPWQRQASTRLHTDGIGLIAVSADGRLAATRPWIRDEMEKDGVRVVDLPSLAEVDRLDSDIDGVAFRPRRDQLTVAFGRHANVELYDLGARRVDGLVLANADDRVDHLAYNQPGTALLAASFQSGDVHRVEMFARHGRRSGRPLSGCFGGTGRFAVDPAGGQLVMEEFAFGYDRGGHLRRCLLSRHGGGPDEQAMRVEWDDPRDGFLIDDLGFAGDQPWVRGQFGPVYRFGRDPSGGASTFFRAEELESDASCAATGHADELLVGGPGGRITSYTVTRMDGWQHATGPVRAVSLLDGHRVLWVRLFRLAAGLVGVDADGNAWLIHDGRPSSLPRPPAPIGEVLAVCQDSVACLVAERLVRWSPLTGDLVGIAPSAAAAAFEPDPASTEPELAVASGSRITVYSGVAAVARAEVGGPVAGLAWTGEGLLVGIAHRGIERLPRDSFAAESGCVDEERSGRAATAG